MVRLDGIWVPLVTPFEAGAGPVDLTALRRLVQHLRLQGVAGFVACGSTGEAAMLDEAEQHAVLATTLDAAGGLPVLMGVHGVCADRLAGRMRAIAERATLAGWLVTPPAYVKPTQAALVDFFTTVADATPLPLVLYDVPARTGVAIEPATRLTLAAHPRIRAIKDCSGSRAAAEAVLHDGRLALLCGNDDEMFDQLARGAAGAIAASAHLATTGFVALHAALAGGRLAEARAWWRQLAPVAHAAFAEPNPAPVKSTLASLGWMADSLRAPMRPASAQTVQALRRAVAEAERAANGPAQPARSGG